MFYNCDYALQQIRSNLPETVITQFSMFCFEKNRYISNVFMYWQLKQIHLKCVHVLSIKIARSQMCSCIVN